MPTPYQFSSESELVKLLKDAKTQSKSVRFYEAEERGVVEVVCSGVSGNTFRAFRNLPVRPSIAFRDWATEYISQSVRFLNTVSDRSAYSDFVHSATLSLCDYWRSHTRSEMGYGRGAKLFNLVLKKFACLRNLSSTQRKSLISLQHVPLDSYTIVGLRLVASDLSIPKSATMKYITSPEMYKVFQDRISSIATKAGVPAIYYDILAWDMSH